MAIYVDSLAEYSESVIAPAARRWGRRWCHMWCDDGEEESLHQLAERIGLFRSYYRISGNGIGHYDLVPTKRRLAIREGAREKSFREWLREHRQPAGRA